MPQVKVCIPVFNGADRIIDVVQSVFNQTMKDFEVCIYNNGSTDNTFEVCEALAQDHRVKHIARTINIGPYRNIFNALQSESSGYIVLVADDMTLEPRFLDKCLQAYRDDPNLAHVYTGVYLHKSGQKVCHIDSYHLEQDTFDERVISLVNNLSLGTAVYGMYNAEMFSHIDRVWDQNSFMRLGDSLLLTKILNYGKIKQVPEPLINRKVDMRSVDYNARLEAFFYGSYKRLSLPFVRGILHHYEYILGTESKSRDRDALAKSVALIYYNRYAQEINNELSRALHFMSRGNLFQTFDNSRYVQDRLKPFIYIDILKHAKFVEQISQSEISKRVKDMCLNSI